MRALVQRVSQANVTVDGRTVGEIGPGLLILVCAMQTDSEAQSIWLARKIVNLRIFRDMAGKMNKSLKDTGGDALVVSQFTLAAETKGNRPGFSSAAPPDLGRKLYEHFSAQMRGHGLTVANGQFGADMKVRWSMTGRSPSGWIPMSGDALAGLLDGAALPDTGELIDNGRALANTVTVGPCPFLTHHGVASEADFKRASIADRPAHATRADRLAQPRPNRVRRMRAYTKRMRGAWRERGPLWHLPRLVDGPAARPAKGCHARHRPDSRTRRKTSPR
jgi:D-tyrosyl-tRNA(Tyr) deacylase